MKEIQLTGKHAEGKVILIDDDMFDRVSYFDWHIVKEIHTCYALTNIVLPNGKWGVVRMHQVIMGVPKSYIDHIDSNGLNNQRSNLRPCTIGQNNRNCNSYIGSSQYKGVYWEKNCNKWRASVRINGKHTYLGFFDPDHEHMAAFAYDLAAMEHYGEFAKLNLSIYNQQ